MPERAAQTDASTAWPPPVDGPVVAGRTSFVVRHSFVVRIWRDEGEAGWRGWIEDTRTGKASFFQELHELLAFIERRTGTLAP